MRDYTFGRKKAATSTFSHPPLVSPHTPTLANPVRGFGLPTNNVIQTQTAESAEQQAAQAADERSKLLLALEQPSFGHHISRIALRRPQAKLTVGEPGDKYEQEADWMANQVMRMVVPDKPNADSVQPVEDTLQRKCTACEEDEEVQRSSDSVVSTPIALEPQPTPEIQREPNGMPPTKGTTQITKNNATITASGKNITEAITNLISQNQDESGAEPLDQDVPNPAPVVQTKFSISDLQRQADGIPQVQPDLESRLNSSQGGGSPLPEEVRGFMEPRFGADFSQVRVHTGSDAVQMNQDLDAQAFTCRSDIYYGAGKSPGTNDLTAHELTHVVQQTGAKILQQKLNDDGTQRVSQQQSLWVQRAPALGFQKQPIIDALNKKPEPDYEEAYRLLNVLAMFDMLSTLNALKRSGQFDQLNSNLGKAVGVNTPRLQIAFFAVQGKADPEMFMFRHGHELQTLPQEQRIDILNFIDAKWVDELKLEEDEKALIGQIRANAVFQALAPDDKTLAEEIITEAQKRRIKFFHSSVYCLEKLKLLFETPEEDPHQQSASTQGSTDEETAKEKDRLSKPAAVKQLDLEEKASNKSSKKMIPVKGKFGGGTYYVDNSDPANIVVKAKIFLRITTNGDAENIANSKKTIKSIKKMEDAIEKAASTKGYLVDIIFVKAPDGDAFTVEVDPSQWETATNWSGGDPTGFAHELHHMFAFELDRYDYIEAHANNKEMKIPDRLYWFRQELNKADDFNDPTSIMNDNRHPNDNDVCTVAQIDIATCTAARQAALSKKK